jgi:hypothetical protein
MAKGGVQVVGLKEAQRSLQRLEDAGRSADATVTVGSALNYAYGIETGRHRSGRVARRRGGVFYLSRALLTVERELPQRVTKGLQAGEPMLTTLTRAGHDIEAHAKQLVIRVTGTLQRSLHTRSR